MYLIHPPCTSGKDRSFLYPRESPSRARVRRHHRNMGICLRGPSLETRDRRFQSTRHLGPPLHGSIALAAHKDCEFHLRGSRACCSCEPKDHSPDGNDVDSLPKSMGCDGRFPPRSPSQSKTLELMGSAVSVVRWRSSGRDALCALLSHSRVPDAPFEYVLQD